MALQFSSSCTIAKLTRSISFTAFRHMHSRYTLTLRSAFCCNLHPFLPTFPLRPTPSRSSRSPTPRHLCTSTTAPYISLLPLMHTAFRKQILALRTSPAALIPQVSAALNISDESQFVPDTAVCVIHDSILLLVCSSRQGFTDGEPFQVSTGPASRFAAPSGRTCSLKSLLLSLLLQLLQLCFLLLHLFRCKPCCATRNSCVVVPRLRTTFGAMIPTTM